MSARSAQLDALLPSGEFGSSILKRTMKDLVADKLLASIVAGVVGVGDDLPSERELARALQVSRETVRGAIQTLAAKGVVEVSQGSRTRVLRDDVECERAGFGAAAAVNAYDLASVHRARLLIETDVVADAALAIDDATLAKLKAGLAAQADALGDPVAFLICDREFHLEIYRASRNPLLADIVVDLFSYMLDHRRVAMSRPGATARSYDDHMAIFEALSSRNGPATATAFCRHIESIYETTLSTLSARALARPDREN